VTKPISEADRSHIANLHKWAAEAATRGDIDASELFQKAAHLVLNRAVADANRAAS
jgi:hypothetical protein